MRNAFINALYEKARNKANITLVTGDLGFGVLDPFMNDLPNQFYNVGICEQNMAAVSAGMAMEGKTVFTYSIANFTTMRCLEQLRNSVCYHEVPVKSVAVGGGFAYGYLGMTHHATEDIAITRALPNMEVFVPADPMESVAVMNYSIISKKPAYIRLGRGGEKNISETPVTDIFKARKFKSGTDTAILVTGAITLDALDAAYILEKKGISCAVYGFISVKPIDSESILKIASEYENIFTLEEHNIMGGFGSAVAEVISSKKNTAMLTRFGLNDEFTSIVGTQEYLKDYYGLNGTSVADKISFLL